MHRRISLAATAVALLACAACGSNSSKNDDYSAGSAPKSAPASTGPATGSSDSGDSADTGAAASGDGKDSDFCTLAAKVGDANLGVSEGNLDPDPQALLKTVDQLDAIAPADLKADFDVYQSFEHAVLDPGSSSAPSIQGNTTASLQHVATYFHETCGLG